MPENTVVCSRPSRWGNPYLVTKSYPPMDGWMVMRQGSISGGPYPSARAAQEAAVNLYRSALNQAPAIQKSILGFTRDAVIQYLQGKNLACWCRSGTPCHCDPLLEIANPETVRK